MGTKLRKLKPMIFDELWAIHEPICASPKKFNKELESNYLGCVWEMVVAKKLTTAGWTLVKATGDGQPDFFACNGLHTVAVECTSIGPGDDSNKRQAMMELPLGYSSGPSREHIALRYSHAFTEKSKQHLALINSGNKGYLIAIHSNLFDEFDERALRHKSSIKQVLYGVDETALSYMSSANRN